MTVNAHNRPTSVFFAARLILVSGINDQCKPMQLSMEKAWGNDYKRVHSANFLKINITNGIQF